MIEYLSGLNSLLSQPSTLSGSKPDPGKEWAMAGPPDEVRLAELVATLSLGTDLGLGLPMEHVIRLTLISLRLADLLGLDESVRGEAYYSGLLAWVGCHTDAYEQAKWFGDDIALKREGRFFDSARPTQAATFGSRDRCRPLTTGPARCVGEVAGHGPA